MQIKILLLIAIVFGFLISPLVNADTKPDPLQYYRDEIKRSEASASQALQDEVQSNQSNTASNSASQSAPAPTAPTPLSNNNKAFSAPAKPESKTPTDINESNSNKNPWLKPNPWAAKAEVNPWANAPIPGPNDTTAAASANSTAQTPPVGPPNIFAPPHAAANNAGSTSKKTFS